MFGGFYARRRVLVTGSSGFKGSWLCHWLLEMGAIVEGLSLPPPTDPCVFTVLNLEQRMRQRLADVRNLASIEDAIRDFRPDIIFHLAAQPLVRESYGDPKGTFDTNVGGTVNCLEAVRRNPSAVAVVVVTTDKCYENREWAWGYREIDPMGGHDPYSASKGAAELVVASYRRSFFAKGPAVATARAGNVIGGGDWSTDRLVSDFVRAIQRGEPLTLRSPHATRPWQHVLEPLSGYLHLGSLLAGKDGQRFAEAWNFGPDDRSVVTVEHLARRLVAHWGSGSVTAAPGPHPHEACLLKLDCSKALAYLRWHGLWDVDTAISHTVAWYLAHRQAHDMAALTTEQIHAYAERARERRLPWATTEEAPSCTTN